RAAAPRAAGRGARALPPRARGVPPHRRPRLGGAAALQPRRAVRLPRRVPDGRGRPAPGRAAPPRPRPRVRGRAGALEPRIRRRRGARAVARGAAEQAGRACARQRRPAWAALGGYAALRAAWAAGERSQRLLAAASRSAGALAACGWAVPALDARLIAARMAL